VNTKKQDTPVMYAVVYGFLVKFRGDEEVSRSKGFTGESLPARSLEDRLDNVVYRVGAGASRPEAQPIR